MWFLIHTENEVNECSLVFFRLFILFSGFLSFHGTLVLPIVYFLFIFISLINGTRCPGDDYQDYYPVALSLSQVTGEKQLFVMCCLYHCSGSAGASVVAHGVALPLYRDCFLDLRLFNSPDLRRLVLCYCCQAWTLETVLGGNTALTRWWTARSIDADAKR